MKISQHYVCKWKISRSEQKAKLQEVMSSTKASATEKNKAKKILMQSLQWKQARIT